MADRPGDEAAGPGTGHGRPGVLLARMRARHRGEEHRASTPLELFFDLCFVVAVSQAGAHLVHAVAAGQPGHGVVRYLLVFFAVWWAWVNFTWFASTGVHAGSFAMRLPRRGQVER